MSRDWHEHRIYGGLFEPQRAELPTPKLVLLHLDLILASQLWMINGVPQNIKNCWDNIQRIVKDYLSSYTRGEAQLNDDREVILHVHHNEIARWYVVVPGEQRPTSPRSSDLDRLN